MFCPAFSDHMSHFFQCTFWNSMNKQSKSELWVLSTSPWWLFSPCWTGRICTQYFTPVIYPTDRLSDPSFFGPVHIYHNSSMDSPCKERFWCLKVVYPYIFHECMGWEVLAFSNEMCSFIYVCLFTKLLVQCCKTVIWYTALSSVKCSATPLPLPPP